MNSNFTFLPPSFKDLADASRKAEAQIMGDPCCANFHFLPVPLMHRAFCGEL